MSESEEISSGFVAEEQPAASSSSLTGISEFYRSASGYSCLYRCERYGRVHLLKALRPEYRGQTFYEQALYKEFSIGYQLEHPHIARTLSWESLPGLGHCILLEFIDGVTLQQLMRQGRLTEELAHKIVRELCGALAYLHSKQIVHRDLKPENILVTHNGQNVKLIDFGLSDCDDYDILKIPAGTRYYLAPEVLQPGVGIDLRADVYSLGVVMGEMATLLNDKRMAAVSRRCTRRRREQRCASATAVAQALEAKPFPMRYLPWAAALLLLVGVVLTGVMRSRQDVPLSMPVYGNVAVGAVYRRALVELRADSAGGVEKGDTSDVLLRLRQVLDEEYPLEVQRTSASYRHLLDKMVH